MFSLACLAQNQNISVYANGLGNATLYSVGVDYVFPMNTKVKPGIQMGGGYYNSYTSDATYAIPVRGNVHFLYKKHWHLIVGGGVAFTNGSGNLDDDETIENIVEGFA